MSALSEDELADLERKIAELREQLRSAVADRDAAVEEKTAATLEQFRLETELRAALDRQKASAEILRSIATTSGNAEHALRQIAETTAHFFNAPSVTIRIAEGDRWVQDIRVGSGSLASGAHPSSPRIERGASLPATVYQENRQIHIPDLDNLDPSMAHWPAVATRAVGIRTLSGTPLRRDGGAIGALIIYRDRLAPFTDEELALQQSFADQAVIAIENARLFNETKEALERQTATSEILRVINNSTGNLAPVFESILEKAHHLCGAPCGSLQLYDAGRVVPVAIRGMTEAFAEFLRAGYPITDGVRGVLFADRPIQLVDIAEFLRSRPDESSMRAAVELGGIGTMLTVPLARDGKVFGRIVAGRREIRAFTDKQIALLQGFADQAVIAIENARLFNETKEALERQTATSDILKVIASSPSDVQPVFDAIAESAKRLLGCHMATVTRVIDGVVHLAAATARSQAEREALGLPYPLSSDRIHARVARAGELAFRFDIETEPGVPDSIRVFARSQGYRSLLVVPMLRHGAAIGTIGITRREAGHFADKEIDLLKTFADQAVIAIENTRLFNETQEALARQTATADILRVISGSPTDVQPVFDAIVRTAVRLLGCDRAFFMRVDGHTYSPVAGVSRDGPTPLGTPDRPIDPAANFPSRAIATKQMLHLPDWAQIELPDHERGIRERLGVKSSLYLPLLRGDDCIGLLVLVGSRPNMFGETEIALAQSFRDQALIAIENTRLFNETKEALERQTATADILKVIASSPSDVKPVFEAIVASANRLLGGFSSTVYRFIDGQAHLQAFTPTTPEADDILKSTFPLPLERFAPFEIARAGEVAQIPDTETLTGEILTIARARGFRSMLFAPLVNKGRSIGIVAVTRAAAGTFADHHVQLLKTFADQAVIAIENTRLFDEVQAKTRDLEESLQQQTATADVLRVIASSPTDVMPVLNAIVESACQLCEASDAYVALRDGDHLVFQAHHGAIPVAWKRRPINRQWPAGRAVADGKPVHLRDVMAREGDEFPDGREIARRDGARSVLTVPLMREGESVGVIILRRLEVQPFTDKQIALLQTFADQAVIAIENTRLFDEVQAKTRDLEESLQQQTATSEVLQVISASPGELAPVFDKMLENATRVCGAEFGSMTLVEGDTQRQAALYNAPPAFAAVRKNKVLQIHPRSSIAVAIRTKQVVQVEDLRNFPAYLEGNPASVQLVELGGARTIVVVPMLREDEVIGLITVYRQQVRAFGDKQIDLLTNFARQAVIAIENARLLGELRQRTTDLSKSLNDLRTAQDRLVQTEKLASLGQLTAGIAHEIKNPLNFVNNFSALSIELTDELNDLLGQATLADKLRGEVDELTSLLKDNLDKVVQHGKRADSIVKNMLLHSREGSGEHRPSDVNALVEESLNLAYHGARAEKPQFNVNLQRDFDPEAGMIEVFPQEITRVLLNLISNGFYAVTKRKADNGSAGFEPLVTATTKGSSSHVEIRIRDNGIGIPPEVKEKMFNPFFTTKPAGEGTGLGLSMSHDIIVKQHGGTIDVDTEPGVFTEFTIILPRTKK